MRRSIDVSLLLAVFFAGCAAATIAAPLVVPPARAVDVQRWEQLCVPYKDEAGDTTIVEHPYPHASNLATGWNPVLKAYGEQGWETVDVAYSSTLDQIRAVCFKRKL